MEQLTKNQAVATSQEAVQNQNEPQLRDENAHNDKSMSLLLPSLLIMFIPSTFKRPVSSWKALNLRKTLLMASSVRLKPLNCSRLPCVYAQETLTFLLTQKKTCVKNYVQKE